MHQYATAHRGSPGCPLPRSMAPGLQSQAQSLPCPCPMRRGAVSLQHLEWVQLWHGGVAGAGRKAEGSQQPKANASPIPCGAQAGIQPGGQGAVLFPGSRRDFLPKGGRSQAGQVTAGPGWSLAERLGRALTSPSRRAARTWRGRGRAALEGCSHPSWAGTRSARQPAFTYRHGNSALFPHPVGHGKQAPLRHSPSRARGLEPGAAQPGRKGDAPSCAALLGATRRPQTPSREQGSTWQPAVPVPRHQASAPRHRRATQLQPGSFTGCANLCQAAPGSSLGPPASRMPGAGPAPLQWLGPAEPKSSAPAPALCPVASLCYINSMPSYFTSPM